MRAGDGAIYSDLIVEALTRYPEREAFVCGDVRMAYAEAADLTARLVRVLAEHGVDARHGVAGLSPNAPEAWLVQAAAYLLGARFSGLHPLGSVDDHAALCEEAEVAVILAHPALSGNAAAIAERSGPVRAVLTIGEDLRARCASVGSVALGPGPATGEDIGWLQYTGGTTGKPKGAMISQRAMAQQAQSWLCSYGVPERPRYLAAAPITHASVLPVLPVLLRGGTVVLHGGFDPEEWLRTVQDERVNYAFAVPTMLYALFDHARPGKFDLSSLETVAYGAAPMSAARIAEVQEGLGDVLLQGYGQTEAGGYLTVLRKDEHDPRRRPELLTSCGRPAAGVLARVLDEQDHPVPDGEVGEICIRSGGAMTGYWKRPELTAQVMRGGWLHTGDMARRDERGFLHIVDRQKDMVISGGFNVYPKEVEDVLAAHPAVGSAAVIGVPDEKWGEAVKAFVVPRDGRSVHVDELVAEVKRRKGAHHAPKSVELVTDLPVTPVGKVDKKALRARYWSSQDRQVH